MTMSRRSKQVASAIKQELADLLLREVSDPRIQAVGWVTISEIQIAPDHRNATVYVSFMGKEEKSKEVQDALEALKSASGFLHRALMKRLALKAIPVLIFRYDRSFDHAEKVARAFAEAEEAEESKE